MDQGPLVADQIDAAKQFVDEFSQDVPLAAAFWLRKGEQGGWHLYIASEKFDAKNILMYYEKVIELAKKIKARHPFFDSFRVRLIAADDPLARDVQNVQQRQTTVGPMIYYGPYLGGLNIDEAYIYPAPATVSSP